MIRQAKSLDALVMFMDDVRAASAFCIATVPISSVEYWSISAGVLSHQSGSFFHLAGLRDRESGQEDLMIYQPQSALNGLAVHCAHGRLSALVQARVEPGNSRIVNLGPTVQATAGNYLRLHGGRKTPYLELFHTFKPQIAPRHVSTQLDLGQFYYLKQKTLSVVEADTLSPTLDTFIWADLEVLRAAARQDHIVNTDLRSMLAATPWNSLTPGGAAPASRAADLAASIIQFSDIPGSTSCDRELIPIKALLDWEMDELGIHSTRDAGRSVRFHDVQSRGREVDHWQQPLMHLSERLVAELLTRGAGSEREFLVSIGEEFGFPGRRLVMPSVIGTEKSVVRTEGQTLCECVQSEEGGRFYRIETRYAVIQVDPDFATSSGQVWLSAAALRHILQESNRASMSLRCVSSLVLKDLYPESFD